ncbi:MAG: hypothetical protein AB1757_08655 [Acidobacteriota bacterium]
MLANSIEDFRNHLEVLIAPADVNRFIEVINHFYPRFHAWWQAGAEEQLRKKAESYRQTEICFLSVIFFSCRTFGNFGARFRHFIYVSRMNLDSTVKQEEAMLSEIGSEEFAVYEKFVQSALEAFTHQIVDCEDFLTGDALYLRLGILPNRLRR